MGVSEAVERHAGHLQRIIVKAKATNSIDVLELVLLQGKVQDTRNKVEGIRDDLQKRRDAAANQRNTSLFNFGANLLQAFFMGKQAAALENMVEGAYWARNIYRGAAGME